jgi:hypothetical protein
VPPDATTLADPVQDPQHHALNDETLAVIAGGAAILNDLVAVHPFASVMVAV